MKHILEQKVYFSDTDAYGVVWHGAYLRWMEMGRVDYCQSVGYSLSELRARNILLPVSSINIKYKSSAKLEETVLIETEVTDYKGLSATFTQTIRSKSTGSVYTIAEVVIVAVDSNGKLYRKIPEPLASIFEQEVKSAILL